MDVILKRTDGIIEIDGAEWMTREKFMSFYRIRKSNFYNQVLRGQILSERLFSDKNTSFQIYRMKEACNG